MTKQWFEVKKHHPYFGKRGDTFVANGPDEFGRYRCITAGGNNVMPVDITEGIVAPIVGPQPTRRIRSIVATVVHECERSKHNGSGGWKPIAEPFRSSYFFFDTDHERTWVFVEDPQPSVANEPAPSRLPLDGKARKEIPLWSFIEGYFPDAIIALASLSFKANAKHNPGQPMHWSREKSSDHKDCILRHLLDEERIDPETGWPEAVAAAWRACANAQLVIERMRAAGRLTR